MPIWRPFRPRRRRQTPLNASGGRSGLQEAGKHVQSSGMQWICCILSPRRAPEARAQNRLGWLAGWLGWLAGLQSAVCLVPEDSVPFGRGPAGCGRGGFFSPRDGFSLPVTRTRPAEGEELPLGTCTRLDVSSKPLTNPSTSAGPATRVGSRLRVLQQCWVRCGTEASALKLSSRI